MKLFEKIQHLVQKKPKVEPEIFLSLILDESYIQAGAWVLGPDNKSRTIATTSERAISPTWEDRIRMTDHAIGKLEEETGSTKISKVVFGLGERFLTKTGDIEKVVRPQLKHLTQTLALSPLGFVPLSTSIAHFLRKTEGIPTSVILIGVSEQNFDITIYRVGRLAFSITVKRTESEGVDIENALKLCPDADVLPSRILLYGSDDVRIQDVKTVLLRHQWTARANFLHYPKIDIYPFEKMIETVIEAGANEITQGISEDIPSDEEDKEDVLMPEEEEDLKSEKKMEPLEDEPQLVPEKEKGVSHMVVVQPETLGFHETTKEDNDEPDDKKSTELLDDEIVENPLEFSEEVKANLLQEKEEKDKDVFLEEEKEKSPHSASTASLTKKIRRFAHFGSGVFYKTPKKLILISLVFIVILVGVFLGITQLLPRVTVTLSVLPNIITRDETILIDPEATSVDVNVKSIPGKKLEKVVSGEKTVAATGKKKVGDPAKGTVTILNKSEGTSYTLKKGTLLSLGSLQFTLDNDVSIASASMNLSGDQLTFGKTSTTVTSVAVGTEGNIDANKEFVLKDYNTNILVARNDKPFSGGTSKEVTVVSRADYDSLQKALTADLIEKAKAELTQSVSGKEKMIDQTVKTSIKDKQFVEEIDQEAKELHGTLTVSVSATTYNEDDIKAVLSGVAEKEIPVGYSVNAGRTTVSVGNITLSKDGTMKAQASISTVAVPSINTETIRKTIAGKKLVDAEKELRMLPGVASAEFLFKSTWIKDVLPGNPDHITLMVVSVE